MPTIHSGVQQTDAWRVLLRALQPSEQVVSPLLLLKRRECIKECCRFFGAAKFRNHCEQVRRLLQLMLCAGANDDRSLWELHCTTRDLPAHSVGQLSELGQDMLPRFAHR